MFSNIVRSVNEVDDESFTGVSDEIAELSKLLEQSHLKNKDDKATLEEINGEINHYDEQLNIIKGEGYKLMSELSLRMQFLDDSKNKVESLNNILQSKELEFNKYKKMKPSTADLDICSHTKKTFITYKNILNIYFDYSNGANGNVQKGYTFNRITGKLTYFEFNTDEKTDSEIAVILWDKIKYVTAKNWEISAVQ